MKKQLAWLAGAALLVTACYNDAALVSRLDKQESELSSLKNEVKDLKDNVISKINSDIRGLSDILGNLKDNVYVKEVTEVKENGKVIGYTITFTDNNKITIYHGKDGAAGAAGAAGNTPVIGVKKSGDVYYWTIDGKYLTDENGQPVQASATDGAPGDPGTPGENGKTPQLRIENGNWEVSYDGENWTVVGPAQAEGGSGDAVFAGVKETKSAVVFTLVDGTKLSIDKMVEFYLKVDDSQSYEVVEGKATEIPYTLVGVGSGESRVDALASGDWWAEVAVTDKESGVLKVTAGAQPQAKVFLYATNGKGMTDIRSLVFDGGVLTITVPVEEAPAEGGTLEVPVVTNVDYTVAIEKEAQYWLSYAITKAGAVRNERLVLTAAENTTPDTRSAKVELLDAQGAVIQSFTVKQESGTYEAPVFEDSNFKNYILYNSAAADYNENLKVDASEAAKLTELTINSDYTSLKGIEAFYNLKKITINKTAKLASIDLSKNKKLEEITISKGYSDATILKELNLSDLNALRTVQLGGMTAIETVKLGSAASLTSFNAYNTALTSLDLSGAPELTGVAVYGTKLVNLDLSKNGKLENVNVGAPTLGSLTLPEDAPIKVLNIDNTLIEEFDLSNLTELTEFSAAATKMAKIDLSNSAKLQKLSVGNYGTGSSNALKIVDVRKAVVLSSVNLYSNVLEEVIVPKGTKTSSWNWTSYHMDPDTGVVTYVKVTEIDVEGGEVEVDDFAAGITEPFVKKILLGKFDKNGDGAIDAAEAEAVTELDFSECELVDGDLNGLEAFPIKKLNLDSNKLTEIDILKFPALEWLTINNNKLTTLSVGSSYTDLKQNLHLEAANNQIATFKGPSYYAKVNYLDLSGNKLSGSFNMPYNSVLEYCDLSDNALTSVNLSSATALKELNVSNNKLTSVSFSSFSALQKVDVSHNSLTAYTFGSSQTKLEEANLAYNQFTQLDITPIVKSAALKSIDLTGNEGFVLLIVGSGNAEPEGVIKGVTGYGVLNASMPTGELVTNRYNSLSSVEGGTEYDMTVNFSKSVKAYKVEAGKALTVTAAAAKKGIKFFAIGLGGTPKVTVSRGDGGKVYDKNDASGRSENPVTVRQNDTASDPAKTVVDGNNDQYKYYLGPVTYSSSGGVAAGGTVILTVEGNAGESVIFFGINMDSYRDDEV